MEIDATVAVAFISLIGTVLLAYLNRELEHRLTKLEERQSNIRENMFNEKDRACLMENTLKVKLLFDRYVGEAAEALKNPPAIDAALTKIQNEGYSGYTGLSPKEKTDVHNYAKSLLEDGRVGAKKKMKARLIFGLKELEEAISAQKAACAV